MSPANPRSPNRHPIRLELDETTGNMKVYFSGRIGPETIREKEETLQRAVPKVKGMGLIFLEDCEASSALVGMIMRLDKSMKDQNKALRLQVLSTRVLALLKSLNLTTVLRLV